MGGESSVVSATMTDVRNMIGLGPTTAAAKFTGAGVGIALIDTGVAPVPGLSAGLVVNGPDLSFESQSGALRYLDTYGHGTHMAGIMVGNGTADPNSLGLAPKAKLTSIKVGTASGAVDATQVIAAIDWVVQHRRDDPYYPIRVINLAYGAGGTPNHLTDPVMAAAEYAWRAGIVVVAAAGNGPHTKLSNPAKDPFVLSVGSAATYGTATNADDTVSTFTNGTNQTITFSVVAPGEGIVSLRDPGSSVDQAYPTARQGDSLFRGSGTSQASAVTSAAVALLLQARPTLSPDDVKQLLVASATPTKDGRAMLNVNRALGMAVPAYTPRTLYSTGDGLLDDSRGTSRVVSGSTALSGQNTIFGPLNTAVWASRSSTASAWYGGVWMGYRFAGDGWTGSSWASRTWGAATWTGLTWSGESWIDPAWEGRSWSGRSWSGGGWESRYWSSDDWGCAGPAGGGGGTAPGPPAGRIRAAFVIHAAFVAE
jgi:serine protease AprX